MSDLTPAVGTGFSKGFEADVIIKIIRCLHQVKVAGSVAPQFPWANLDPGVSRVRFHLTEEEPLGLLLVLLEALFCFQLSDVICHSSFGACGKMRVRSACGVWHRGYSSHSRIPGRLWNLTWKGVKVGLRRICSFACRFYGKLNPRSA